MMGRMPARTKGRAKLDFHGRPFIWWVDDDRYLRIASLDKKFVISATLLDDRVVEVIGSEFPGLDPSEVRPVRFLVSLPASGSIGAMVEQLLQWSFDPALERVRIAPIQL